MSKDALLGSVTNLGKSDLIHSIAPGGADAAVDYRGISNYIQTVRISYTWTSTDTSNGYAIVPVVWKIPFADTNYTSMWGVNDLDFIEDISYWTGDMHNKIASGFNAVVYSYSPGQGTPGDILIVNAIGIHD